MATAAGAWQQALEQQLETQPHPLIPHKQFHQLGT